MAYFGCFPTFPIFSYQSDPNSFRMVSFAHFATFSYFPTEVVQIDSEWPILAVFQLFQYFPTKVVQIHSEQLILAVLQLFQYFLTRVVHIDSDWPILAVLQLSNIFLPKWSKLIQNGQFSLFCNFPIFSYQSGPNLYGMANFGCFATFQYFLTKVVQIDSEWPIWPFGIFSNCFQLKSSEIV